MALLAASWVPTFGNLLPLQVHSLSLLSTLARGCTFGVVPHLRHWWASEDECSERQGLSKGCTPRSTATCLLWIFQAKKNLAESNDSGDFGTSANFGPRRNAKA